MNGYLNADMEGGVSGKMGPYADIEMVSDRQRMH